MKAEGNETIDFESRFFGPRAGINEDPVTGSAHCALAKYWAPILKKNHLYAYQASARGGFVTVVLPVDQPDRVILRGEAVVSRRGTLESVP